MSTAAQPSDNRTEALEGAPTLRSRLRRRAGGSLWLRSVEHLGRNVRVTGPVLVRDRGAVVIGDDVVLDAAEAPIELLAGPQGRLVLGAGTYVGPGASLEAGASVDVGAGAVIGAFAKVLDNNWHGVGDDREERPESLPVVIGPGARLGARSIMVPGSALGEGSELADDSVLSGRVPAGIRVAGVPARRVPAFPEAASTQGIYGVVGFPQVDAGRGPVGIPTMLWLAGVEGLGRLPLGLRARRVMDKSLLGAALVNARRQLRGASVQGRAYTFGAVDVSGPGSVQIGDRTTFVGGPIWSRIETGPGAVVRLGDDITCNYGVYLRSAERIEIGSGSMLGSRVLILDQHGGRSGPVLIGNRVWLAHGVTVLPGVSIGDGSAVSAGTVVDRDVSAGSLAFGSPLRFRPLTSVAR